MSLPAAQRSALLKAISTDRLSTYQAAASAKGVDVLELYLWDRNLASAVMADVAVLEVALRNSMNTCLVRLAAGRPDWYSVDIGLDNRSLRMVSEAWKRLPSARRTPGRVVAQLMFGFWRDLLEAGGHIGWAPLQRTANYEDLWRSEVRKAFPGGRAVAAGGGEQFTRPWTLAVVKEVHALRNRAAHHEPLVNGFPLPGENRRLTGQQGLDACHTLAAALDRDLAAWLVANSRTAQALAASV